MAKPKRNFWRDLAAIEAQLLDDLEQEFYRHQIEIRKILIRFRAERIPPDPKKKRRD